MLLLPLLLQPRLAHLIRVAQLVPCIRVCHLWSRGRGRRPAGCGCKSQASWRKQAGEAQPGLATLWASKLRTLARCGNPHISPSLSQPTQLQGTHLGFERVHPAAAAVLEPAAKLNKTAGSVGAKRLAQQVGSVHKPAPLNSTACSASRGCPTLTRPPVSTPPPTHRSENTPHRSAICAARRPLLLCATSPSPSPTARQRRHSLIVGSLLTGPPSAPPGAPPAPHCRQWPPAAASSCSTSHRAQWSPCPAEVGHVTPNASRSWE